MNTRTQKILTASLGLCVVTGNLVAQVTLTNLYSFGNFNVDGKNPMVGLVQGRDVILKAQRAKFFCGATVGASG